MMLNRLRQTVSNLIAPSRNLPAAPAPQSRVTTFNGAYNALFTRRADLALTDTGLAQAASLSVWAARCMNVRASAIARADWYVVAKGSNERIEDETNVDRALMWAFTKYRQNLMYNIEMSQTVWGETFIEPLYTGGALPGGLRWINNLAVSKNITADQLQYYEVSTGGGRMVRFQPDELFWMKYQSPLSDLDGLAPMVQALQAVNVSRKTIRFIQAFYDNDASPGGVLTARDGVVIDKDEEERIIAQWEAQHRGAENAFFIALLPHSLQFQSYDNKPPDNQTELNEEQRREICGALNVPMAMVDAAGVSDPLSAGATMGAQQIGWLENWFEPEIDMVASWWNAEVMPWLMPGYELHANTEDLLLAAKQNADRSAMQNARLSAGGMSVNEWRKQQGMEPKEGWDVHFIPSGVTVIHEEDTEGLLGVTGQPAMPMSPLMGIETPSVPSNSDSIDPSTQTVTGVESAVENALQPSVGEQLQLPPAITLTGKGLYDGIDFSPTSAMKREAQRGLDWRKEYNRGGQNEGVSRARDIINGRNLSPDTVRRMFSFFARHESNKQAEGWKPGEDGYPSAGRIAWALWGGDPGKSWADARWKRIRAARDKKIKTSTGKPSGAVIMRLYSTDAVLEDIRGAVRTMLPEARIRLTTSPDWHITLAHAELIDDADAEGLFAALVDEDIPGFVTFDGFGTFEKDAYTVIYLRVQISPMLRVLQSTIYTTLAQQGVVMSDYSVPDQWTAHITVAYVDAGVDIPEGLLTLDAQQTVPASGVEFTRSEYVTDFWVPPTENASAGEGFMMAVIKSVIEELATWERFALKRVSKSEHRAFKAQFIPEGFAADIQAELDAGGDDPVTIRAIFKAARVTLRTDQGDDFSARVWATKSAQVTDESIAILIQRMRELGIDDMVEQIEGITGEDTSDEGDFDGTV